MTPLTFWLNPPERCPKCKQSVRLSYIEADNDTATLNYACDKCGMVKVRCFRWRRPSVPRSKGRRGTFGWFFRRSAKVTGGWYFSLVGALTCRGRRV
jgi:hypothetical protein